MPRIAGALAVVATIAACIGWNTSRYPIVWEMAGNFAQFPPPPAEDTSSGETQASQSSDAGRQAPQAAPHAVLASIPAPAPTVGSHKPGATSRGPGASMATYPEATATGRQLSPHARSAPPPLVPVSAPGSVSANLPHKDRSGHEGGTGDVGPVERPMYRLPPVDEVGPSPNAPAAAGRNVAPVSSYPATGISE